MAFEDVIRGQILTNLATRLAKVKTANGYSTNVQKVYYDDIPMGIQLRKDQLPAIFLISGPDLPEFQQSCVIGNWEFIIQLWHNEVSDKEMENFSRNVFKAIYADSPTAQVWDQFRKLHERVFEVIPLSISPDLHMIKANRITELRFRLKYRTKLYDL